MTAIYLIRHGQASFAEQDYDKLSIKGIEQAKMLGMHWQALARHKENFAESVQYYSGSLLRHEQTAEYFFNGLLMQSSKANHPQKGVITHAGFNELDHVDVLSRYNKNWQSFQAMCNEVSHTQSKNTLKQALGENRTSQSFRQEFALAMKRWVSGEFDDYQESWSQFQQRCITSLQEVVTQSHAQVNAHQSLRGRSNNKDLVIFTSGGVIGVILGHILARTYQNTLQISQQLINSSVTKIIAKKDGFKLSYLNNYSHLEVAGQEWLSYF